MKFFHIILLFSLLLQPLFAQQITDSDKKEYLTLLDEFLSIPNNGLYPEQIEANIEWLKDIFSKLGFEVQELENEGPPLFYASKIIQEDLPTVLFYMHLDGQAVDPAFWDQEDPYQPVYKSRTEMGNWQIRSTGVPEPPYDNEWRVFARSASDDKGPIVMLIAALHELKQEQVSPAFNIKVILDGEEEQGSPNLAHAVSRYGELLQADALVVSDGPMHDSGLPTLTYGVRGITTVTMEVYGPSKPQHSGHFGNYAPNPVFRAAHLLASMKDDEGRVTIEGYYDGIGFDEYARETMNNVPDNEEAIQKRAGFAEPEKVGENYQEAMQYPSLNVRGIRSAWVGDEARTIVPDKAIIEMDIRTVPETDGEDLVQKIQAHVRDQGYTVLATPPTPEEMLEIAKPLYLKYRVSMEPFRTSLSSPVGRWLKQALEKGHEAEVVQIRILGGSLPITYFVKELDIPAVLMPLVNADNNQHSPNENLRFGNFFDGIESFRTVFLSSYEE